MGEIDKKHHLDEDVYSYRSTKDGKIFLFWNGKQVMILKGMTAQKFLRDIDCADPKTAQLLMARLTGNFKRGNESK